MSKSIEVNAKIGKDSRVYVKPSGTEGEECIDIMRFVDGIPGLTVEEEGRTDDYLAGGGGVSVHQESSLG